MENRVWDRCCVRFVGFEDEEETLVVGCGQSRECGDLLERLIVFDIGEFEGTDERSETFGTEPFANVRERSRGSQNTHLNGFFSMNVLSLHSCKKRNGVCDDTTSTCIFI